jgi:hypothetical protein
MNLQAVRIAILVTELLVFLVTTAFMTYFISLASAPELAAASPPPPAFPVVVYTGDRAKPDARGYRVMPWSDWEALSARDPAATLLLPQPAASFDPGADQQASYKATELSPSRQSVDLTWRDGNAERRAHYVATARAIEPISFLTLTTQTFLLAALAGFGAGMMTGKFLRLRFLPRPGTIVPLPPK